MQCWCWVRPAMLKHCQLCRKTCYRCQCRVSLLLTSPTQAHLPTSAGSPALQAWELVSLGLRLCLSHKFIAQAASVFRTWQCVKFALLRQSSPCPSSAPHLFQPLTCPLPALSPHLFLTCPCPSEASQPPAAPCRWTDPSSQNKGHPLLSLLFSFS